MNFYRKLYWPLIVLLLFVSCEKFEYNPYQTNHNHINIPKDLNQKNLSKLFQQQGADDTVCFIFTGDSQRFYDELEDLVTKANTVPNVDFLVLSGDITDFGLLQEFLWIHERLDKLKMPYLAVIGNHDLIANGSELYEKIFGPKNFSFIYKQHKFLFHDTNGREYNFNGRVPDINWMRSQLSSESASWFVGVSHVPPHHEDFDRKNLEDPYVKLLSSHKNFILSLNGHNHDAGDTYHYDDHVRYITSNSVSKRNFVVIKLINGKIFKENVSY